MRISSLGNHESGIVIVLVAVALLFVVGAMAALSIDMATRYTAHSEAQLAADSAALAAARVLANSGATSDTSGSSMTNAWTLATAVALQVAEQNQVAGANLTSSQITIPATPGGTNTNPTFKISVQITNLPTFFARIWGTNFMTVGASATAEVYNPSSAVVTSGTSAPPVAPICVKPWLLPNIDPTQASSTGAAIFDRATGAIVNSPALLGAGWPGVNPNGLSARCGDCSGVIPAPVPGQYYPGTTGATGDFSNPQAVPSCTASAGFNAYQLAVAGCVSKPISCGTTEIVNIDPAAYPATRDADTVLATSCLIHDDGAPGDADNIQNPASPTLPFQFVGGNQNPIAATIGKDVLVSDSLVTIPVIDTPLLAGGLPPAPPVNPVTVIGFIQVFLDPTGASLAGFTQIPVTIVNIAGCGTKVTGHPILGNGASPVAVRLISP